MYLKQQNGCKFTQPKVSPQTWRLKKSFKPQKHWKIYYRFYDPTKPKIANVNPLYVPIRNMNDIKDHATRVDVTEKLLADELAKLQAGYNPQLRAHIPIVMPADVRQVTSTINAYGTTMRFPFWTSIETPIAGFLR
jgi:hypothetical protein